MRIQESGDLGFLPRRARSSPKLHRDHCVKTDAGTGEQDEPPQRLQRLAVPDRVNIEVGVDRVERGHAARARKELASASASRPACRWPGLPESVVESTRGCETLESPDDLAVERHKV